MTDLQKLLEETKAKVDNLTQMRKDYEKRVQEEGTAIVTPFLKAWIQANPLVAAITWRQYTPYFNDGDECWFGIHGVYFKFSEEAKPWIYSECSDYDDGFYSESSLSEYVRGDDGRITNYNTKVFKTPEAEALHTQCSLISTVLYDMKDLLKAAFGDHMHITVTAASIQVDEYSHD